MKKALLLGILFTTCLLSDIHAKPRNLAEARRCAAAISPEPKAVTSSDTDFTPYYIFNDESARRFVLVSGSDLTRPIIGYGEGQFDPDAIPDNLRDWLKSLSESISHLERQSDTHKGRQTSAPIQTSPIAPLLGNIQWSQNYPFNLRCPVFNGENSAAGCVATAGAQCIYHHRYPSQGEGIHTDANNPNLSINFSASTYDYDLMFDSFQPTYTEGVGWSHNYTEAQMYEVAKLTYHCGIMSDMIYSAESSSASLVALQRGLIENMKYDPHAQIVMRRTRTYEEWNELLQNELRHNRPIIFSGASNNCTSGHSFIVDGIDDKGLYHANWGWSGSFNGYYDVTLMRPEDETTVFNPDGYSAEQRALIQIAPKGKVEDAQYISPLSAPDGLFAISSGTFKMGSTIKFNLIKFYNYSSSTFKGFIGIVFVRDGKKACFMPVASDQIELESYYGLSATNISVNLPPSLPEGDYQIYPAVQDNGGPFSGQTAIIYSNANYPSYAKCRISGGNAIISDDSYDTKLTASDWNFEQTAIKSSVPQEISCTITNGNPIHTLVGHYFLLLTSPKEENKVIECKDILVLTPRESGKLTFRTTFPITGQWKSQLLFFHQNVELSTATDCRYVPDTEKTFEVTADATTGAVFTLTEAPRLISNAQYGDSLFVGENASFQLSLRNTGKAYSGLMQIQLFKTTTSSTPLATVTQQMDVPAYSEGRYTLSGTLNKESSNFTTALSGTTYYAKAFYDFAGTYKLFTTSSGVDNRLAVKCYGGSPATALDNLPIDDLSRQTFIYDLQGRRLSADKPLPHGIYIINGKRRMVKE